MLKMRISGIEVEGDPDEMAAFYKKIESNQQIAEPTYKEAKQRPPSAPIPANINLPSKSEIAEWVESLGAPYSFSLAEQQMRFFGRYLETRKEQKLYSKFYALFQFAKKSIVEKHGGKWISDGEVIDGHLFSRFKWIPDEEAKKQENLGAFQLNQD
jgi:hypothetical protein